MGKKRKKRRPENSALYLQRSSSSLLHLRTPKASSAKMCLCCSVSNGMELVESHGVGWDDMENGTGCTHLVKMKWPVVLQKLKW